MSTCKPYFDGAASVHFVMHPHRSGFSCSTCRLRSMYGGTSDSSIRDIIHFETFWFTGTWNVALFAISSKMAITIHDPVPHSGGRQLESAFAPDASSSICRLKKKYLFYSEFARKQFETHYKKGKNHEMRVANESYTDF